MKPTSKRQYHPLSKLLHWVTAGLLVVQIPLAYFMISQPLSPAKLGNYALHKSLGLTIFAVTALRVAWQLVTPRPRLPVAMSRPERIIARSVQLMLYGLLLTMPLTGWLNSSAANIPVSFFFLFTLPNLVAPDRGLQSAFQLAHRFEAYTLFVLLSLHVGAALQHHYLRRDNVLRSMLPFARGPGTDERNS